MAKAKAAGETLTTPELCSALGITRRALSRALARGCPVHPIPPPSGKGGRPRHTFYLREVEDWFAVNVNRGAATASRAVYPSNAQPELPVAGSSPAEGIPLVGVTEGAVAALARATNADGVIAMRDRLERADEMTYAAWRAALAANAAWHRKKRHGKNDSHPPWSVGALSALQKAWQDTVGPRRQLEKELPVIMHRRGRYVDAQTVGKIFTNTVLSMIADLNGIGLKVASRCVGKTAREIRGEIDEAVREAQRHLQGILKPLATGNGTEPTEEEESTT